MTARSLSSRKVWLAVPAGFLAGLGLLLAGGPDSAAHDGHSESQWAWTWRPGTAVFLDEYRFWHYNDYEQKSCTRWNPYLPGNLCEVWTVTGETRRRYSDSCAAKPEWVVAAVSGGQQRMPSAPSGASCNRHDSYTEGSYMWVFSGHRTVHVPDLPSLSGGSVGGTHTRKSSTERCQLPGTGIQSAATSADTGPPTGATVVYTTDQTRPGQGGRCGYWSGPSLHTADATTPEPEPPDDATTTTEGTTTTAGTTTAGTTTTVPRPTQEPGWTGACYETFGLGELMGDRQNPEIPLPWYNGADKIYHSGRLPQGVGRVRIEGEQYLYGQAGSVGTFNGRLTAWLGRKRLSTQECVLVVEEPTWIPSVCEFVLEVGESYDLSMPRLRGVAVKQYYRSGGFPPGMSTSTRGALTGSPTSEGSWTTSWRAVINGVSARPSIPCTFTVVKGPPPGWSGHCDWTFTVGTSYTRLLPVATGATSHSFAGDAPDGMRLRSVRIAVGVSAQRLSGTPTAEGIWTGTLTPTPTVEGVDPIDCSFEVLPDTELAECSRTIPSDQIDAVREALEWRTDVPRAGAHSDIPGGDHLITTGDPGAGGGSPRVWPWWAADDDLTVTDTSGCVWRMTAVISSAQPLFPWYGNHMNVIRTAAPSMRTQWLATSADQRTEIEATGRRLLRRVGLGNPEDEKWLGGSCEAGDTPDQDCVWGVPFPGVWQWSLTIRYESDDDYRDRDLTLASGATRFWRFADQVG